MRTMGKQSSRRKKDSGTTVVRNDNVEPTTREQKSRGVVMETSDVDPSPERSGSLYRELLQAACEGDYDTILHLIQSSQAPSEIGIHVGIDLDTLLDPEHSDHPTLRLTALQAAVTFDRRTNTDRNTNANAIMVLLQEGAVRN